MASNVHVQPSSMGPGGRTADVVVIGAGIIGASCAYHLAAKGLRVVVLEQDEAAGMGSTGRSFASVRAQWGDPTNVDISWRSIQTYRDFERIHGTDVGYAATGYMFLVPEDRWDEQLQALSVQRAYGVPVEVLSTEAAQQRVPFEKGGLAACTWGSADGVVDPHLVTQAYLKLAREHGASVRFHAGVTKITRQREGWQLDTPKGVWTATNVVNAAGGWAGAVASLAGLDVPVNHVRRIVYSTSASHTHEAFPMTVDVGTGVYLRSEGPRVLFSLSRSTEPMGYNLRVDWDWMEVVMETACRRFPWLADRGLDAAASWGGTYDESPDHRPFLGRHPNDTSWVNACGFSGHGVMQAPEVGRLVTEEVVDGRIHSMAVDSLRIERLNSSQYVGATTPLVF